MTDWVKNPVGLGSNPETKPSIQKNINHLQLLPAAVLRLVCVHFDAQELCRLATTSWLLQNLASSDDVWRALSVRDCLEGVVLPVLPLSLSSSSLSSSSSSLSRPTKALRLSLCTSKSCVGSSETPTYAWRTWYRDEILCPFLKTSFFPGTWDQYDGHISLVLLGTGGTGKSCFSSRYYDSAFPNSNAADFRTCAITCSTGTWTLRIWEISHPEAYHNLTASFLREAHGVFIAYNVNDRSKFEDARHWFNKAEQHTNEPNAKFLLLGLQADRLDRQVSLAEGKKLAEELGILFAECSSKTGKGVSRAVSTLLRNCALLKKSEASQATKLSIQKECKCVMQ